MRARSVVLCLGILALLLPALSLACGPYFAPILLDDRMGTLFGLPDTQFFDEMMRLVPKSRADFVAVEQAVEPADARVGGGARETALYEAGAKAFRAGDLDLARTQFAAVRDLAEDERRRFGPFAAYMLGRMAHSPDEAQRHFADVRELVAAGSDDPIGLAVASFGEEARALLRAGDDTQAMRLYAEQASYGSNSGASSLLRVARALSRDDERLERVLEDPLGQRILATYAWTRPRDQWWIAEDQPAQPMRDLLDKLAAVPQLAGADRLALAAWREGRFDLAERLAGIEQTALDTWVRAKLELRRGNREKADRLLAEAAAQFDPSERWEAVTDGDPVPFFPGRRVHGERGVLALSRGDFLQAAEHLLPSCSWPDIAYVTERILTVEELEHLVAEDTARPCPALDVWGEGLGHTEDTAVDLRVLLARRLLRGGRGEEAMRFVAGTRLEEPARAYVESLQRARSGGDELRRAEALYRAAVLARDAGFDLLATEMSPDWAWVGANFDLGDAESRLVGRYGSAETERKMSDNRALTTTAEVERGEASRPAHDVRFQYRSTAADLAEKAAALLSPRSQAYAALLCHAARFSARSEPERVSQLWRTYVENGAVLRERMVFGEQCPEPDFERARRQRDLARAARRRHALTVGAGAAVLLAAGACLLWWVGPTASRRRAGTG